MKKLQLYILKETFRALAAAFAALALIMVVGFCMQLLHEGLDVVRLRALLPPLLYYCVPMVLPSAFLTAVIMTFGRLSAENELMAIRAAGIHPFQVIYPVLGVAVLLSAASAFFHFETLPRARGKIKALKYRALQQILLDKVALSTSRQFSFRSVVIKYDDFKDGKMINMLVLVLEAQRKQPRAIIRAASCTIRPDPQLKDQAVLFEMKDCVMWERGKAGTPRSEEAVMTIPVAPDPKEVLSQEKYRGTGALLSRLRELRKSVEQQPVAAQLGSSEKAYAELQSAVRRKDNEIRDLDGVLRPLRNKYEKYTVQEPRLQQQLLESHRKRIAELEPQLKTLRDQQTECEREIQERAQDPIDHDRLEDLEALLERNKILQGNIEDAENEIKELKKHAAEAEEQLATYAKEAEKLEGQMHEMQKLRDKLARESEALRKMLRWARAQRDLRKIKLRIHKRLAQALSVLVFALVGIPIGMLAGGRSVMIAFGISFGVVLLIFYPLLVLGQIAAEAGALPVAPAIWAGNAFTFVIGAVLMAKAVRR